MYHIKRYNLFSFSLFIISHSPNSISYTPGKIILSLTYKIYIFLYTQYLLYLNPYILYMTCGEYIIFAPKFIFYILYHLYSR
nr:MAG TPA: hypothetical protein [Caudoviricetes sp.]